MVEEVNGGGGDDYRSCTGMRYLFRGCKRVIKQEVSNGNGSSGGVGDYDDDDDDGVVVVVIEQSDGGAQQCIGIMCS